MASGLVFCSRSLNPPMSHIPTGDIEEHNTQIRMWDMGGFNEREQNTNPEAILMQEQRSPFT
jgi:hypothetical protein